MTQEFVMQKDNMGLTLKTDINGEARVPAAARPRAPRGPRASRAIPAGPSAEVYDYDSVLFEI